MSKNSNSAKLSKIPLLGKLQSEKVVAAMEATDYASAAEQLEELYAPVLGEGEAMPDWAYLFDLDARLIAALSRRAEKGDQHRRDAVAARVLLTQERDKKMLILRDVLSSVERRVRRSYGPGALRPFGIKPPFDLQPDALVAEAVSIRERLLIEDLRPSSLQSGASPLDWTALAVEIDEASSVLAAAIAQRKDQQETAVQALLAKRDGLKRQRMGRLYVVQRVEATFRMCGLEEEADRLRLTIPQRPSTEGEPAGGDPPPEGGETPNGGGDPPNDAGDPPPEGDPQNDGGEPSDAVS